jgi:hypothetical protein
MLPFTKGVDEYGHHNKAMRVWTDLGGIHVGRGTALPTIFVAPLPTNSPPHTT